MHARMIEMVGALDERGTQRFADPNLLLAAPTLEESEERQNPHLVTTQIRAGGGGKRHSRRHRFFPKQSEIPPCSPAQFAGGSVPEHRDYPPLPAGELGQGNQPEH